MFGRDEEYSKVRTALLITGTNPSVVRDWQKRYDRLCRQWPGVKEQYENARATTEWVRDTAKRMESMLTGETPYDKKAFTQMIREMKRKQNTFDHVFIVSRSDHEFHSTYDTIVRLGAKACETQEQKLILQSEIENLLALTEEALQKERPSTWKLACYLTVHTGKKLEEMPMNQKLKELDDVYADEITQPVATMLVGSIVYADKWREEGRDLTQRKNRKFMEATKILDNEQYERESLWDRANRIVSRIAEL